MSVLLGIPSRNIQYINVHKEGTGNNEFCDIDSRWTNPILDKLDDYLVAITRFEVPANRIPMTQKLKDCIQIFAYDVVTTNNNIEDYAAANGIADIDAMLNQHEAQPANQITPTALHDDPFIRYANGDISHRINMPPCFTIYSFLKKLNAQINEVLLFNTGQKQIQPIGVGQALASSNANHRNKFVDNNGNVTNDTDPIAFFRIVMDRDFTFRVEMNYLFAQKYYIKMSPALFNMLNFKEGDSGNFRQDLGGRRFMASRVDRDPNGAIDVYEFRHTQFPPYIENRRQVNVYVPAQTLVAGIHTLQSATILHDNPIATFVAPISAADSINRLKSLVFTSSIATSSEALTGGGYRRTLTDYTIPIQTGFNYNPETFTGSISENAASEYTYTNPNPSAGRFLQISDPSPLYELKVEVFAKCWDFETNTFVMERIPLPIAGTFSIKLVFISRSELHRRHKPDQLLP